MVPKIEISEKSAFFSLFEKNRKKGKFIENIYEKLDVLQKWKLIQSMYKYIDKDYVNIAYRELILNKEELNINTYICYNDLMKLILYNDKYIDLAFDYMYKLYIKTEQIEAHASYEAYI